MTVKDLIEVLQQCEDQTIPVHVRVFETNAAHGEPVFSKCEIRDITEGRGVIVMDVEE